MDNTVMKMIDTTEMDMDAKTERVAKRILPMPTEKTRRQLRHPYNL